MFATYIPPVTESSTDSDYREDALNNTLKLPMTQEMTHVDVGEARELPIRAMPRAFPTPAGERITPRLAVAVFLLVFVFCMLASYLGQHSHGVATIWLSNGLLFAIIMRQPRSTWPAYLLIGYCADTLGASIIDQESVFSSVFVSACNTLEIAMTALLLHRWFGPAFKLSRPRPLFAFFGTGVILAPLIACALASLWLSVAGHTPWFTSYRTWFLGDALGMAIVAPLVFTVQEPDFFASFHRHSLPKTLLIFTVPIIATLIDFVQGQEPLPILIMPSLIYVTFRRGFPGAVVAVFFAACVAISVTILGHGLMTLGRDTDPLEHIVAVQVFVAATLFAIFPIAALLEESQSLALSLKQSETRYIELANTDALTGQANRRAFDARLEMEYQRAVALQRPVTLLSLDIDLFKSYNDLYGHIAGDDCLRQVSSLAAQVVHASTSARLYRVGGEEFAIILPDATLAEARNLAERIRTQIFSAQIEHRGSPFGRQTVSVGIASEIPSSGQPALSLLARSDKALYAAKHNGRNRCEAA